MNKNIRIFFVLFIGLFLIYDLNAQGSKNSLISMYLDCNRCDVIHIKRNINYVNYVRDPDDADLHVLVTDQRTGGGRKYEFHFIGLEYELDYKLKLNTPQTDTWAEVREEYVRILKAGLMPFISQQNKEIHVNVDVPAEMRIEAPESEPEEDPWNYWIFEIESSVSYEKEQRRNEFEYRGGIDADKITPDWRVRVNLNANYEKNEFDSGDEIITTFLKRYYYWGSAVRSVSDHWSVGLFTSLGSNTYRNLRVSAGLRGAIEFNIYPYDISNRREFSFAYYIGSGYNDYFEETIYSKTSEFLWGETVRVMYRQREPWGNISANLEGFHYFHNFRRNHLELDTWISVRLVKGLFFKFGGEISLIRDQIYLPLEDASLEEILLQRKALQTDFSYDLRAGLSYTFGSIYNNYVNTRL